ncbi:MAG: leucyl/phenylalanyl-tRNA--protein transferase [Pseudomonadota bacterium]
MDLTPDLILKAYACGVFPMADSSDSADVYWVDPKKRGILPLGSVHVPRRLRRTIKQAPYDVRIDTAFHDVMQHCAERTNQRSETWINSAIFELYGRLFRMGYAHSVECWQGDTLVGGLYGVRMGAAFFGESMFHRATDASKIALMYLVARLRIGGFMLLDTQFITDHLKQFGTIEISRDDYHARLEEALPMQADFYRLSAASNPSDILQSVTQRS